LIRARLLLPALEGGGPAGILGVTRLPRGPPNTSTRLCSRPPAPARAAGRPSPQEGPVCRSIISALLSFHHQRAIASPAPADHVSLDRSIPAIIRAPQAAIVSGQAIGNPSAPAAASVMGMAKEPTIRPPL